MNKLEELNNSKIPTEILNEATKHASNSGMMYYISPEKEKSFIVGAMSNVAKEYWFKEFNKIKINKK